MTFKQQLEEIETNYYKFITNPSSFPIDFCDFVKPHETIWLLEQLKFYRELWERLKMKKRVRHCGGSQAPTRDGNAGSNPSAL